MCDCRRIIKYLTLEETPGGQLLSRQFVLTDERSIYRPLRPRIIYLGGASASQPVISRVFVWVADVGVEYSVCSETPQKREWPE